MTNSSPQVGGLRGAKDAPLPLEMAAYDHFPPELRRAIQDAPAKVHCAGMQHQIQAALSRGMSPSLLASKVKGELNAATRTLARGTYGPTHPQA